MGSFLHPEPVSIQNGGDNSSREARSFISTLPGRLPKTHFVLGNNRYPLRSGLKLVKEFFYREDGLGLEYLIRAKRNRYE